jgi:hypothetical protein
MADIDRFGQEIGAPCGKTFFGVAGVTRDHHHGGVGQIFVVAQLLQGFDAILSNHPHIEGDHMRGDDPGQIQNLLAACNRHDFEVHATEERTEVHPEDLAVVGDNDDRSG